MHQNCGLHVLGFFNGVNQSKKHLMVVDGRNIFIFSLVEWRRFKKNIA